MRKVLISLLLALVMVIGIAAPVFANDVNVELGDIVYDGNSVTGTVAITSEVGSNGLFSSAYADSDAWYSVNGAIQDYQTTTDADFGWFSAEADASQVFSWSYDVPNIPGVYDFEQGGEAFAAFSSWWPYRNVSFNDAQSNNLRVVIQPPKSDEPDGWATAGQFSLRLGGSMFTYNFTDGTNGNTLPAINEAHKAYYNGVSTMLKVVIPSGTKVTGGKSLCINMTPVGLSVGSLEGKAVQFSNPVVVYEQAGGEWVEITSFQSTGG